MKKILLGLYIFKKSLEELQKKLFEKSKKIFFWEIYL